MGGVKNWLISIDGVGRELGKGRDGEEIFSFFFCWRLLVGSRFVLVRGDDLDIESLGFLFLF